MDGNGSVLPRLVPPTVLLSFVNQVVARGGQRVLLLGVWRFLNFAYLLLNRTHTLLDEGHLLAHGSSLFLLQVGTHEDSRLLRHLAQVLV